MISDRQKRQICRTTFGLFCLAPTVLVIYWILVPPSRIQLQRQISDQTGVLVSVARIKTPRPGTKIVNDLQMQLPSRDSKTHQDGSDSETKNPFWTFDQITIQNRSGLTDCRATSQPVAIQGLAALLESMLERQGTSIHPPQAIRIRWQKLPLRTEFSIEQKHSIDLFDVDLRIQPFSDGWMAKLEFRVDPNVDQWARIEYEQKLGHREPFQSWTLDTGQSEIPLVLLSYLLPEFQLLGSQVRFSGVISARKDFAGWDLELKGKMANIDLHSMVGQPTGNRCQGMASIDKLVIQIQRDRIVRLSGSLHSNDGVIDGRLLHRIARLPNLRTLQNDGQPQVYTQLNFEFQVVRSIVNIWSGGRIVDQRNLANTAVPGQPLIQMTEPNQSCTLSFANLLKILFPENTAELPINERSMQLMNLFSVSDPAQ